MSFDTRSWLELSLGAALVAFGIWLGGVFERTERLTLELAWEQERAALADARTKAISRALDIEREGEAIAVALAASETARNQLAKDKTREIARLTSGRKCLSADAVGLLNTASTDPGLRLPAPAADSARTAATFATDTDVGQWASAARDQYDLCRGRIDALRQWSEGAAR